MFVAKLGLVAQYICRVTLGSFAFDYHEITDLFAVKYHQLLDYAEQQPESDQIFSAID